MNPILAEIITSVWLINNERKDAYAALLMSLLNGEKLSDEDSSKERAKNRSYVISGSKSVDRWALNDANIPEGSIAVIPIRSEIMKYDQACGPRGSATITKEIEAADQNQKIKSILLIIDSPGGQVTHTDILSQTIKESKTPVIAFVEGMAASAAYWIASSASKIIASSDLDRIGSIGTMLFFADLKPYYEEMGVKFHEIYASKSKDKNKDINDVLEGKYDDYRKNTLDKINEKFHAAVKSNRPSLDEKTLTGKIYFANEAISLGLIDEIGSMQYALEQADLIPGNTDPDNNIDNNSNSTDMKIKMLAIWTAIATFFGYKAEEVEGKELNSEMVGQINDHLASLTQKNNDLEKSFQEEHEAKIQLEKDLAEAKSSLDEKTRELEALKNEDASDETIGKKDSDVIVDENALAGFAHNKLADSQ